jgi:hypothetical protein
MNAMKWAEGLIRQLPENHDGRNSWLLNHGSLDIKEPRIERAKPGSIDRAEAVFSGIDPGGPDESVTITFEEALIKDIAKKDRIYQECVDHPLFPVLMAAIEQAMYGKGERHGGAKTPFFEQPWVHYQRMHGRGFLTGQSAKKLEEAAHQREGKPFIDEALGAIVYAGMAILREQGDVK